MEVNMNPEQTLSTLAASMTKIAESHTGDVLVCVLDKQIVVVEDTKRGSPMKIVERFKAETVRAGLTPDEWHTLSRKITRALKEPK
jgi:hypothetical protein